MRFGLFGRRRTKPEPEAVARIRLWLARILKTDDATRFAINEIDCADPGCVGIETVALVMQPDAPTWALKVKKPMAEVTELDLRLALAETTSARD